MPTREYPLHKGAKTALTVTAVLCILLCVSAPFGIYILWRKARGKLSISERGVEAAALGTTRIDFANVARLGVCQVPIAARGIGGALARQKVGGSHAVNVCVILRDGKKRSFTASMFENYEEAMGQISNACRMPFEQLTIGLMGVKWP
jgi:hypothetical protein